MIRFKNRMLVLFSLVSLAVGWGTLRVAAQGPTVPPSPPARATVTPIALPPIVVAPPANSTWTVNDLLPKSRMTPFPTKAPGQTFLTPPPQGWYQQYQTTPLPSARSAASSASANSSGWSGNVPNWIDQTYAQTQAQTQPKTTGATSSGGTTLTTNTNNAAGWTNSYLAWARSAAETGLPAPIAKPMIPAPQSVGPLLFGSSQLAGNYFDNASRDVNAAVAAYADAPRRAEQMNDSNFWDKALGGTLGGQSGGFYDTAPLVQSPIGNATAKTTYERQVTVPVGDRRIPVEFQVPGVVPWVGGQTLALQTTYDVYQTDQGVRNVRVHDLVGAFQYAQDFAVSYPADQTRALDGGYGNAFAMSAFNAARSLMGQSALTQDSRYAQWFPNNQTQNLGSNMTVNAATAQAYGDGWFGILNMGANFFDTAALCARANQSGGPKVMKQILTPEQTLLGDTLAMAGYDATSEEIAIETFGGALGEAMTGADLLGAASADAAVGTDLGTASATEATPTDSVVGAGAAPDLPAGEESVSVKAVIPQAAPQWTWSTQPPYPVVAGQDPTKRGVDVLGQVTLAPCTVIYHHVRIDYWYYCGPGKASCDCSKDSCEVRSTRSEWDTTDYEPDALAAAQVTALLSAKSTQYIQAEMQTPYPGAKVQQGSLTLFPNALARVIAQRVGVPSFWSFVVEKMPVADPGTWDVQAQTRTMGTAHCAPLVDQQTFPSVFSAWLREQRLVK